MARGRSPNRNKAFEIYKQHNGDIKLIDIAAELNIKDSLIRKWKSQDKWDEQLKGALLISKSNVTNAKKKSGAPLNNKNALGNKGGAAPKRNKNAETNGFFSKYLPEDTFNIIKEIEQKDPLDILWENIQIQYAAIIRAQNIMNVANQNDHTKELVKETRGDKSDTDEWEIQYSWDKQATFLQAQSRAMKTLESMIKNYDELLHKNWNLATEEQKARIEVLRSKVPNKDTLNIQEQINTIADLINNPVEERNLEDD